MWPQLKWTGDLLYEGRTSGTELPSWCILILLLRSKNAECEQPYVPFWDAATFSIKASSSLSPMSLPSPTARFPPAKLKTCCAFINIMYTFQGYLICYWTYCWSHPSIYTWYFLLMISILLKSIGIDFQHLILLVLHLNNFTFLTRRNRQNDISLLSTALTFNL